MSDRNASDVRTKKRTQDLAAAVDEHQGQLRALIKSKIRDQVEAEDILQDTFEEFFEAYDLGQAFEAMGGWLVRVAQNKILDRFRRKKTRSDYAKQVIEDADDDLVLSIEQPDEEFERSILNDEILKAIELLPEDQRTVFVKHEIDGLSFAEIAQETKTPINTLLSRKRYAVIFLREYLKEIYDE